jgi:ribosome-binding protein aMBF1 (putative translation factor)
MAETIKIPVVRTPEEKAEERRIREMHRQNPICEVPNDTMTGEDAAHMLSFAAAIRSERVAQGLSIQQLADMAGLDAGVLARFESGQSFNPTVATLCRIVRALGRELHWSFSNGGRDSCPT